MVASKTWQTGRRWFESPARPIIFPRIDDSHCDRILASLTAVHCFDDAYVRKQPVAWKEYCAEYWFKELQESMGSCTGRRDLTEIMLQSALNTIQSISQSVSIYILESDHVELKQKTTRCPCKNNTYLALSKGVIVCIVKRSRLLIILANQGLNSPTIHKNLRGPEFSDLKRDTI